jgi:hypothetical protein
MHHAKVNAQRHARVFSLWPLSTWIYESGFANFVKDYRCRVFEITQFRLRLATARRAA